MTQPRLREISPQKYLSAPLPSGAEGLKPINANLSIANADQGRRKSNVPAKVKEAPNRSSIHQDTKTSKQDNQNPQATLTAQMEKLNNVQIRAFRQIFENFDLEKSGTLTAEELHKCINQLAGYQALSFQDVVHILEDLDVKGTGDIEFDEFIFFMTRPQNLEKMLTDNDKRDIEKQTGVALDKDQKGNSDDPGDVLFKILQRVLEQDENTDLKNFYRQQILNKMDDNVIHDWSDGKRVIGLSNAQIMKRYDEITAVFKKDRNFNKHLNSPYAKPSHWGIAELKRDIAEKKRQLAISTAKEVKERGLQRVKVGEMEITVEAVQLPVYWVKDNRKGFTYDHVKEIRDNVAKLKKSYYRYLKDIAYSNAQKFHGDLGIDQIKNKRNRRAANNAFESYCNPFVVSPWVPTPNPTSWKVSTLAPVGRAMPRKGAYRK
jgi:Ca2+-binding EF-hand superfamily protein